MWHTELYFGNKPLTTTEITNVIEKNKREKEKQREEGSIILEF